MQTSYSEQNLFKPMSYDSNKENHYSNNQYEKFSNNPYQKNESQSRPLTARDSNAPSNNLFKNFGSKQEIPSKQGNQSSSDKCLHQNIVTFKRTYCRDCGLFLPNVRV